MTVSYSLARSNHILSNPLKQHAFQITQVLSEEGADKSSSATDSLKYRSVQLQPD